MRRRDMITTLAGLGVCPKRLRGDAPELGPMMLPTSLAARLNAVAAEWSANVSALGTPDAARERNAFVRTKERDLLVSWPAKTPLKPRVVKTTERDGYRIENVMYQSRPDFWVTANLYVPTRGHGPYPAVLAACGHYDDSRFHPDYQLAFRDLVENGFVVLAFDPIGQGERRHFWNPETNQVEQLGMMGRGSSATTEHTLAGHVLELFGENVNQYFVWDGMCGIDYLFSRREVDPKRIGCAGHSGGGTATMYLSCADERIQCVVIHEGGLGHQWPIDPRRGRLEPADGEQNLFGAAMYGMDFVELSAAIAPRPLLISIEHFNPAFNAAAADVKKRYTLLAAEDRFSTVEANAPHAWTRRLSLADTDWFSRFFYQRSGPAEAPDYKPEPEEVLRCVPNGSLRYSGFDTVFTRAKKQVATLHLGPPAKLRDALRNSRLRNIDQAWTQRETAPGRVEISSEPGIVLPGIVVRTAGGDRTTVVYLDDAGAEAAHESGLLDRMAQTRRTVVAVDVRGIGRSKMTSTTARSGTFVQIFDAETWATYSSWQLEDSLLGMRVADTLCAVNYARSLNHSADILVVGKGIGALLAMLTAALDPRIAGAVCHGGMLSYATMASAAGTLLGADLIIRGVLKNFDLPDVAASIASRPLRVIDPVDAMRQPVDLATAKNTYQRTTEAYSRKGAAARFQVLAASAGQDLTDLYCNGI